LTEDKSATINEHFKSIFKEDRSDNVDKKQAILLHLQMILVEARRAAKNAEPVAVPKTFNHIHGFLALLESAFQVKDAGDPVKLKTVSEFADELHVHPNYLNSLVKQQTGKTVREHIQDRMLYEAKSLLLQTDWDINNIGYGLGFSGHAAFTSFFRKKENVSPSVYRKTLLNSGQKVNG
jgi:AraC-like DNA-binding protein